MHVLSSLRLIACLLILVLLPTACRAGVITQVTSRATEPARQITIAVWLTTPDLSAHLTRQPNLLFQQRVQTGLPTLLIDAATQYQQMVGIGASLTQTASSLLARSYARDLLMQQLFDPQRGIGISFLREPLGSSDFSDVPFYSYEDVPGQFDLGHDRTYSIPLLQEARRLNPDLTLMGTPWSPPGWMKDSGSMLSGTLRPDAYSAYAAYLVQALHVYQMNGLPFAYLSVQNEPGIIEGYPGSDWSGPEEARFITGYLKPALAAAGLSPTILGYDRACCLPAFLQALADAGVESAYHCYGPVPATAEVVGTLFETECATSLTEYGSTSTQPLSAAQMLIDWAHAGSRTLVLWNIAADPALGPQPRGNAVCHCLPLLTIQTDASGQPSGEVIERPDFYVLGQWAKFIRPQAIRIGDVVSNTPLESDAFLNTDGTLAVPTYNPTDTAQPVNLSWLGQTASYLLPAHALATFVWSEIGREQ